MSRHFAAALAACFLLAAPATGAPFCKTLKGEWVGIGTDSTRQEAESRLDKEIASWRERYKLTSVKPKGRKVGCQMYIKALDEFFCTAEAVVCR